MSPRLWYVSWMGKIDEEYGDFVPSSLASFLDVDLGLGFTDSLMPSV